MLACFIQILVTRELSPHSFITFVPSLTYFISHYLLLIRRKWIAEMMLLIFLVGILGISMLARYHKIQSITYDRLLVSESPYCADVKNERVMVITDDIGIYKQNRLAGFFLDWRLSREILERPDYYENVILVNDAFQLDPPDVIVDPQNLMKQFFERIPSLGVMYKREGTLYRKSVSTPKVSN